MFLKQINVEPKFFLHRKIFRAIVILSAMENQLGTCYLAAVTNH